MEWATWSDTKLAVLLFPNITRSWSEAYQAFGPDRLPVVVVPALKPHSSGVSGATWRMMK